MDTQQALKLLHRYHDATNAGRLDEFDDLFAGDFTNFAAGFEPVRSLATMKKLMPLVTAQGNVYRAQVVGFFDEDGPADRLEVVIDKTQSPPVIRRRWSLRKLGPGYTPEVLGVPAADVN